MAESERYSMKVGNIEQQELDLLECLIKIDSHQSLDPRASDMLTKTPATDGDMPAGIAPQCLARSLLGCRWGAGKPG